MSAPATDEEIRDVNTRYHDGAAADYDAKWGIDFGAIGREQVLGKVRKALGTAPPVFARADKTCEKIRGKWQDGGRTLCQDVRTAWQDSGRAVSLSPRPRPRSVFRLRH